VECASRALAAFLPTDLNAASEPYYYACGPSRAGVQTLQITPGVDMGGARQKKKKNTKGKKSKPAVANAAPEPEPAQDAGGELELSLYEGGPDEGPPVSFDDMLYAMKEEEGLTPAERAKEEAKADAAEKAAMESADAEDYLSLAQEAHATLWAKVDKLEPQRDEWYVKWQQLEIDGQDMGMGDVQDEFDGKTREQRVGAHGSHRPNKFKVMGRVMKLGAQRLTTLNTEIAEHTREILKLEAKYAIASTRKVNPKLVCAKNAPSFEPFLC
jgi:hypothetical protein